MPALVQSLLYSAAVLCIQEAKAPSYQSTLANVAKTYRIELIHEAPTFPARTSWGAIEGRKPDPKNLERYAPLFVREFTLLPPSLIEKAKLKRVVLCEDLSFVGQHRNAVPDWENDVLYLDVSSVAQRPRYLAAVIHHEFFHIIDYRDNGQVYRDDAWSALNAPGFKYGAGGKNSQSDKSTTALTSKYPGFLTHYGTTGVEEDKAELYAHLIVNPAHVKSRANEDPILRAKIARMKALLAAFCPAMNDAFWQKTERIDHPWM